LRRRIKSLALKSRHFSIAYYYPRTEVAQHKAFLVEINEYIEENTYVFENTGIKEFNIECLQLLIEENRSLREQLESQIGINYKNDVELRKLKRFGQYYQQTKESIIVEQEGQSEDSKKSCSQNSMYFQSI